jgi:hypothetical protein
MSPELPFTSESAIFFFFRSGQTVLMDLFLSGYLPLIVYLGMFIFPLIEKPTCC